MKILVFTGAGLSAESGVSTFRDQNGLWENHKIEEVCDFTTWEKNYDLVHNFYDQRRLALKNILPNHAHEKIAEWCKEYDVMNFTTNVDTLLEQAGSKPIHLHGIVSQVKCVECGTISDIGFKTIEEAKNENLLNYHNKCSTNNSRLKPNVVFFHEMAPNYTLLDNAINSLTYEDVVVVIGASLQVVPIDYYVSNKNCMKININPNLEILTETEEWINIKENATTGIDKADMIIKKFSNG